MLLSVLLLHINGFGGSSDIRAFCLSSQPAMAAPAGVMSKLATLVQAVVSRSAPGIRKELWSYDTRLRMVAICGRCAHGNGHNDAGRKALRVSA